MSMYFNDFSVRVPEGIETPGGYVELQHGQQYRLVLNNNRAERCDAKVEIDGKHVGTWRIEQRSTITLERPVHDTGQFTFYQMGTPEAAQAALNPSDPDLGLVKVTFTPERHYEPPMFDYGVKGIEEPVYRGAVSKGVSQSYSPRSRAGGTGLSGRSGQRFTEVGALDYDYTQQTVIHLRLVAKQDDGGPRPLTSFSTQVPPRVY